MARRAANGVYVPRARTTSEDDIWRCEGILRLIDGLRHTPPMRPALCGWRRHRAASVRFRKAILASHAAASARP